MRTIVFNRDLARTHALAEGHDGTVPFRYEYWMRDCSKTADERAYLLLNPAAVRAAALYTPRFRA